MYYGCFWLYWHKEETTNIAFSILFQDQSKKAFKSSFMIERKKAQVGYLRQTVDQLKQIPMGGNNRSGKPMVSCSKVRIYTLTNQNSKVTIPLRCDCHSNMAITSRIVQVAKFSGWFISATVKSLQYKYIFELLA